VFHLKFGLDFLRIYGMNSIAAYVLSEVVNFRGVAHSVCFGLEQWLGAYYGLLLALAQVMFVFLILRLMLKHNVFLKV
jgi:predicted acyltransferase